MIITSSEQSDELIGHGIGLYNVAFPVDLLKNVYDLGSTELEIVQLLEERAEFIEGIMDYELDSTEQKVKALMEHYDLTVDNVGGSAATQAQEFFTSRIHENNKNDGNDGFDKIAIETTHFLLGPKVDPDSSEFAFPEFVNTANIFKNKILVSYVAAIKNSNITDPEVFVNLLEADITGDFLLTIEDVNEIIKDFNQNNGVELDFDEQAPTDFEVSNPPIVKSIDFPVTKSIDPPIVKSIDFPVTKSIDPLVVKKIESPVAKKIDPPVVKKIESPVVKIINPSFRDNLDNEVGDIIAIEALGTNNMAVDTFFF